MLPWISDLNPTRDSSTQSAQPELLLSVVITTFNRADLASECLRRIRSVFGPMVEVVLADDCSDAPQVAILRSLVEADGERTILTSTGSTSGLGANINRGFAACSRPFVLWVQDDFFLIERGSAELVFRAVTLLNRRSDIDIIRLHVPYRLPVVDTISLGKGRTLHLYPRSLVRSLSSFSLIYSDNPHLRRRSLNGRLGPYLERPGHGCTEIEYSFRSFRAGVRIAGVPSGCSLFQHVGDLRSTRVGSTQQSASPFRRIGGRAKLLVAYLLYCGSSRFPEWMYRDRS